MNGCDRAARATLVCWTLVVVAPTAAAVEFRDDPVGGSCRSLVRHQAGTGVQGRDGRHPGFWGVTEPVLFIGTERIDAPDAGRAIEADVSESARAPGTCVTAANFRYVLRGESRVTAIDWQHGRKPDSECAKEWARMRAVIRTHELQHVKDVDDAVRDENARVAKHPPIEACATTREAAGAKLGAAIRAMLEQQVTRLKTTLAAKAAALDVQKAFIDCTRCKERVTFTGVTIGCTIRTPTCAIRTGQKLTGSVCGDPLKDTWRIDTVYFTEGCGVPPGNGKNNKPYENDCAEAGGAIEQRRIATYRKAAAGAGGWMCSYSDSPKPQVTVRAFWPSICSSAKEETITVDVQTSACD